MSSSSGSTPQYHTHCLISGSTQLKKLAGYEKDYLVKSRPVGFVFSSRIPTEEELINCYEGYSREDYLSPVTVKRYHELLDDFEQYRQTGKLLDVGCGIGLFLIEAKKRGWEVYGTEFTDKAMAVCESAGLNMQQGKLNPDLYRENEFDVVTSFEVLEHIYNPQEEIQNIKKILRPGGLFYFTTPNFNALERRWLKGKYDVIAYPEHLSYYTKKTADYLLTKNGFTKKRLTTTGISLGRIASSLGKRSDYVSETAPDEVMRRRFEKKGIMSLLKTALNAVLDFFSLGNSLKGWYINRKPR